MKKVLIVVCLFVFAVACSDGGSGSGSGGGSGGAGFNVAGCTSTSLSGLGLTPTEQAAASQELNDTFNNYRLWDCSGSNSSALDAYGNSFGTFDGIYGVLGYNLDWWYSDYADEGWGYAPDGLGGYIALWGSW
ncbi:MAG: hypothetical protein LBV04_01845 [Deferribacteraceae bacterium]|jgi:hypothetical protein|nr:hypothetical protein [Deferribacteraceae bacterium]